MILVTSVQRVPLDLLESEEKMDHQVLLVSKVREVKRVHQAHQDQVDHLVREGLMEKLETLEMLEQLEPLDPLVDEVNLDLQVRLAQLVHKEQRDPREPLESKA